MTLKMDDVEFLTSIYLMGEILRSKVKNIVHGIKFVKLEVYL